MDLWFNKAKFMDLHLSTVLFACKAFDKRQDFELETVCFPSRDIESPRVAYLGVYTSQLL